MTTAFALEMSMLWVLSIQMVLSNAASVPHSGQDERCTRRDACTNNRVISSGLHFIQKQVVSSIQRDLKHENLMEMSEQCHDSEVDRQPGKCWEAVNWARTIGLRDHRDWYPEYLTSASTFQDFQAWLHSKNLSECPQPCLTTTTTSRTTTTTAETTTTTSSTSGRGTGTTSTASSTTATTTTTTTTPSCYTAKAGEACFEDVKWAMQFGIKSNPGWYPSWLTVESTFEKFQQALYEDPTINCTKPCPRKEIVDITDENVPANEKLEECQGSCDNGKNTCADGLTCFSRTGKQPVPGCVGEGSQAWGYCVDPDWLARPLPFTTTTTTTTAWETPIPGEIRMSLMTWNVYYKDLASSERLEGVASTIARISADISVITELWGEKPKLLALIRQKTGRDFRFCDSGPQETTWDGDILYDADKYEVIADGVKDWRDDRGLSWAVLKHKQMKQAFIVYGAHPLCCGNEDKHLRNAADFAEHVEATNLWPALPVVLMGDLNVGETAESLRVYKGERVEAYGEVWKLPITLGDTYRDMWKNRRTSGSTFKSGIRLDYVLTERRSRQVFRTVDSWIWPNPPGGSDHYPIGATVVLQTR
eukprot:TRINITY_DN15280_c0_g3_i1.p1 TRINITY_DN15280_c0_g3~~TRINITY_DN15280_c0_g3_i1.p1  ORF type:complete len:591 (+),score=102.90 TRINITY_DN15280_c0_g3_i1:21-1793(+)